MSKVPVLFDRVFIREHSRRERDREKERTLVIIEKLDYLLWLVIFSWKVKFEVMIFSLLLTTSYIRKLNTTIIYTTNNFPNTLLHNFRVLKIRFGGFGGEILLILPLPGPRWLMQILRTIKDPLTFHY